MELPLRGPRRMSDPLNLFCTTPKGMEPLLATELEALGADGIEPATAGVGCRGDLEVAYRVCLWSRTANRLLLSLARFPAETPEVLYAGIQAIDWATHMGPDDTLAVDANVSNSQITHSRYAALKVKDAIVDQFRERHGRRPSVDTEQPSLRINVYIYRDQARLSLDLSGESLHRRGYRAHNTPAPLKENLAAAILLRAGWPAIAEQGGALVDPMCGSATLPIEAALMAGDVAPGLLRQYYGFLGWRGHDIERWKALRQEAQARRQAGARRIPPIFGFDADAQAVKLALDNVAAAGLQGKVHVEKRDARDLRVMARMQEHPGLVVVNPPYGERIGRDSDLPQLYYELGQMLQREFRDWHAALFTGNPPLARNLGIRSQETWTLYNGAIECKLLNYRLSEDMFLNVPEPSPRARTRERDLAPAAPGTRTAGADMLANRLQKNLKNLGRWARQQGVDCYRLYDADLPEYAIALDLYQGDQMWAHVQEYEAPATIDPDKADARLRDALGVIPEILDIPPEQVFLKVRQRQKGKAQYERKQAHGAFYPVRDGAARCWVNFTDYLDTGLFLDHRLTRQRIGELARDKRFLNLFCYTGVATVHAALGGARSSVSVDMSRTYLDWARRNLRLNDCADVKHELVQADCLAWLEEAAQRASPWQGFDLIFLDPPTFSTSKRMEQTWDVQRDHVRVIRQAMKLLTPAGVLLFSTNFRKFKLDTKSLADLAIEDISRKTLPQDFARNPRIHQCWLLRHRQGA